MEKKAGATTPPTRTHGANGLSWLEQSKKDLRKKERLEQKGKSGDETYKDTQRLIGGKQQSFFKSKCFCSSTV